MPITLGRNDACHCGSGKKYKKCHLEADEKKDRKDREKAALNAAKVAAENAEEAGKKGDPHAKQHADQKQGWIGKMANKVGMFRGASQQRRTGPSSKGG